MVKDTEKNTAYQEAEETESGRQYGFIELASHMVQCKSRELGRTMTYCLTTFGCQMNFVPVTA